MTIAEQIYTLVKTLPQDEANEILAFVESIKNKHNAIVPQAPWVELIHSLAGSWTDDFPDLETIRAGMGQDILRENL